MSDSPEGQSEALAGHAPGSRAKRPGPSRRSDAVVTSLIIGIISTVLAILGILAAALTLGDLGGEKAPRTYAERQISSLAAIVESQPTVGRAWADLARAYMETGQLDRAEQVVEQGLVAAASDRPPVLVEQARVQYRRGDSVAALGTLERAIDEANAMRSNIVEQSRKKGIVMDPRAMPMDAIVSAAILESVIHRATGQPAKAVDALTVALGERSNMADVLTSRGTLYIELRRPDEARKDFEAALVFIPDYADAKKGLERLKAGEGK